jgi:hypothetical protein
VNSPLEAREDDIFRTLLKIPKNAIGAKLTQRPEESGPITSDQFKTRLSLLAEGVRFFRCFNVDAPAPFAPKRT